MKYLAIAESGLTNAVSPQKASGFWQIMATTAHHYELEIGEDVDERFNVEKATEAACKVLQDAYNRYGNWTMAAASYNLGMGGIDKQINKQKTDDYYNLFLNEETARYIYRIVAIKEIISRPKAYGYHLRKQDLYPPVPVRRVKVDTTINDLASFAISQNSSYKILKTMNAWLLTNKLTVANGKAYTILFPAAGVTLYGFDDVPGGNETIQTVDTSKFVTRTDIVNDSASRSIVHKVRSGETWNSIAAQYGVPVEYLLEFNKKNENDELKPEEEIVIPRR
jgi:LysM repeat protein